MIALARIRHMRGTKHARLLVIAGAAVSAAQAGTAREPQTTGPAASRPRCAALPQPRKDARQIVDGAALASSFVIALRDQRTISTSDGRAKMDELSATACDVELLSVAGKSVLVSYETKVSARTGTRYLFKVDGADEWFRLTDASSASALAALTGTTSRSGRFSHALVYRTPAAATVVGLYRGEPAYAQVREAALAAFAGRQSPNPTVAVQSER